MAGKAAQQKAAVDPRITKKRVTGVSVVAAGLDAEGRPMFTEHRITDYVREDFLDAYVADLRTRVQHVEVSEEYDAGPGGYDGETAVPARLAHPLAGQTFPATEPTKKG